MRVVDRVHDGTADGRADALPAVTASFTDLDVGEFGVANFTDGGAAGEQHATHFGGGHTQDGVLAFLSHELDAGAGGTSDGSTLAGLELDGMDGGTNRDGGEGHGVAGLDVGTDAADDLIANLQALGVKDVALLAVHVVQQRDARVAVRVVFDRRDLGGHAVLVALEIDDTITTLVAAALMASGNAAVVVASSLLRQRRKKRLLRLVRRDLRKVGDSLEAAAGACRLVLLDSHFFPFFFLVTRSPLSHLG